MNEIKFSLNGGRMIVICRFDSDNTWEAILFNTSTYKTRKLFCGTSEQLDLLLTILIQLDKEKVLKEDEPISTMANDIKKAWKDNKNKQK